VALDFLRDPDMSVRFRAISIGASARRVRDAVDPIAKPSDQKQSSATDACARRFLVIVP
jgi:hypothetical protein